MALPRIGLSIEYLREASPASLQSFELSRLNHAANLRREIATLIDQWIAETSEALLARWMLDHRNSLYRSSVAVPDPCQSFLEPGMSPLSSPHAASTGFPPAPPHFADPRQSSSNPLLHRPQKHRSTA